MGSNEHGQLGLGFSPDLLPSVKLPTLVNDIIVKKVTCGESHTLAIDLNGFAYGWGLADHGAIGVRISSSHEPSMIQFSSTAVDVSIKDVSCGAHHSCFLSVKGEVYSCGRGDKGQLGIGFISIKEYRPIVVRLRDHDEKIKQVSCGMEHTCFLTASGKIFATGSNAEGQLGIQNKNKNVSWPEIVEMSKLVNFKQICCGRYSSAIDEIGHFYAWGHFNGCNIDKPTSPDMVQTQFVRILQSDTISAAIDIEGKMWAWTNYSESEIQEAWKANGTDILPLKLPTIPRLFDKTEHKLIGEVKLGHNFLIAIGTDQPAQKKEQKLNQHLGTSLRRKSMGKSKSRDALGMSINKYQTKQDSRTQTQNPSLERRVYKTLLNEDQKAEAGKRKEQARRSVSKRKRSRSNTVSKYDIVQHSQTKSIDIRATIPQIKKV